LRAQRPRGITPLRQRSQCEHSKCAVVATLFIGVMREQLKRNCSIASQVGVLLRLGETAPQEHDCSTYQFD